MAKGISINFLANVRDFLRGTSDVEKAFDDVAGSLDDVARDGERSTEKLEAGFRELAATAKRETLEAGNATRRNIDQGADGAKASLKELGNEAKQNAAETFSSFNGSAESFADGIQGTLGGVVASLPPQFAALAAAGAIGFGLVVGQVQKSAAETEKLKAKTAELGKEYIDTAGVGVTSLEAMVDKLQELAVAHEDGEQSLSDLAKLAEEAGLPFDKIARAYVDNADALERTIEVNETHAKQLRDEADQLRTGIDGYSEKYQALIGQAEATETLNETLRTNLGVVNDAAAAEQLYLESGAPEMERKAQLIESINDAYDDSAGSVDDFIKKEGQLFDVDAYVKSMKARTKALEEYQSNLAAADLSDEAKAFLTEQGAEAASKFLAGYVAASPKQKAELNAIWSEAGKTNSGEYSDALIQGIKDKKIKAPKIEKPDTTEAERVLVDWAKRPRSVEVEVKLKDQYGRELK